MIKYLLYFLLSLAIAYIITPFFRSFAKNNHIVARQNHRTVHEGEIPKLGGGAIFFAFLAGMLLVVMTSTELIFQHSAMVTSLVVGGLALFLMGAIDDKADLNCNLKLAIEVAVAIAAVSMGWRVDALLLPAAQHVELGWFAYPFSVLWIVGVINSFNMIDGLDGLAAGIAVVVLLSSLGIAVLFGNVLAPFIIIVLLGASLGFLRYNINPASIFMGDSGSLSLGFFLACITINASTFSGDTSAFLIPLLLLGLPLTDTSLAIIRRWRRNIHPFHADREHVHHRLVNLGLSQSGAATAMVGLTLILGLMAYLVAHGITMDIKLLH